MDEPINEQVTQVEQPSENQTAVDISEVENSAKAFQASKAAKSDLETKVNDVPETDKYTKAEDTFGNEVWKNNENDEVLYDEPEDIGAKIKQIDQSQLSAFEAAIKVKETEMATSRQQAIGNAEKKIREFAGSAFEGLPDEDKAMLVNDVVNSQMPKLVNAIDGDNVDWMKVSLDISEELERRKNLLQLREKEQAAVDQTKREQFPLEVTPMSNVQGDAEIRSHKGWTRAMREKWISNLAANINNRSNTR